MNVSLSEQLKAFAQGQVNSGQYGSTSEYVRELIRRDQDRILLRGLVLDGASSPIAGLADPAYFARLRSRASPEAP
ncbi:MAG: type II toxin-antitoxin system ParD family antitoxin [Acidimicrobiaceae bacterium]|nr:type II toxin-antitoxin system ParD family antitoxin [Acidimicrobiaceae bacterium]MYH78933.1 type II toxin-antitoxin system ParD family antitoxin [Acidimicrobiaceae bacterium]